MKFQILDVLNNEIDAASVELWLGDRDFLNFFIDIHGRLHNV